jgi:hypothetical protein
MHAESKRLLWSAVLLCLGLGCAVSKTVRLETGQGRSVTVTPRNVVGKELAAAKLDEGEWREAIKEQAKTARPFVRPLQQARELFSVPTRTLHYKYDIRNKRLIGANAETRGLHLVDPDEQLAVEYRRWCERVKGRPGDCLCLLEDGTILGSDAKYSLALALAMGSVLEGMNEAFKGMVSDRAVISTTLSMVTMYLMFLILPEPVSKGAAAAMTVAMIGYVGIDTLYQIIDGWSQMVLKADAALTFAELRAAGEPFGKLMGAYSARAFVMMAMALLGRTTADMAKGMRNLPKFPQAAAAAEAQAGVNLAAAVESAQSVAVTAEGLVIRVAPYAVAMSASGMDRTRPVRLHHEIQQDTTKASTNLARAGTNKKGQGQGYPSFDAFKREYGQAGKDKAWHHIVEQGSGNVERFGAVAIHNTDNIILLDAQLHNRISGFYSSKPPGMSQTIREWLSTQSFEAQREFGLQTLRKFGAIP